MKFKSRTQRLLPCSLPVRQKHRKFQVVLSIHEWVDNGPHGGRKRPKSLGYVQQLLCCDGATMIIDFHSEFFPERYIEDVDKFGLVSGFNISVPVSLWNYVAKQRSIIDVKRRIRDMDEMGVDMQVISMPVPGVNNVDPEKSAALSRMVNQGFAEVVERHPDRFTALACLPMLDVEAAVEELNRAVKTLGLKGAKVCSNVAGKPLDSPEFWPIYEAASHLDVPVVIHPTAPAILQPFRGFNLTTIIGFPFETTLAAARLVFSGVLEKYDNLKVVFAHLGGTIPFLVERLNGGYRRNPECRRNIKKPPTEYLKKTYLDTVSFHEPALRCAYAFLGADKLLLGSDYPYWWWAGDLKRVITSITDLEVPDEEKILGRNAERLLKL